MPTPDNQIHVFAIVKDCYCNAAQAVRYEVGDDGEDEKMPDLFLKDKNDKVSEPWIGDLCTLVEWNNMFGPTDFERRRDDRVMELQGNRNPFIDNPGWVNLIWQEKCD